MRGETVIMPVEITTNHAVLLLGDKQERKAERRAEIGHKGRRHDDLANLRFGESGFYKHCVDHRQRSRTEGNTRQLGGSPVPVQEVVADEQSAEERGQEGDSTNEDALLGFLAHDLSINFRACKKGQEDAAETGDVLYPIELLDMERVAGEHSQGDLDNGGRDP